MKQYKCVRFSRYEVICKEGENKLENLLNELASKGWTLKTIIGYEEKVDAVLILERDE